MKVRRIFIVAMILVGAAAAQTRVDELKSKITAVRYNPLAAQARIQGDVHLKLASGVVTVLSGHPILARTAEENARTLGSTGEMDLTYHFGLADPIIVPTSTIVKRGNALERAVLRMFGRRTEKVVLGHRCESSYPPPNEIEVHGGVVEIWIYANVGCLNTQTSTLVARL
jgi:hypothetical protein